MESLPDPLPINDAALRQIVIGMGGRRNGIPRESYFAPPPRK